MKKKLLSILTSAVMAATCLGGGLSELTSKIHLVNEPLTAEAYDGTAYGDYLYYETVDEDYVYISDCDSSAVSVEIPAEIDGLPVTSIGYKAFYDCSSLASITIPNSVTSIGNYAFYGCSSLASITIPDSVTSIGLWAFYDCTSLESITIGSGVTSIGDYAFGDCSSLASITIPDSVTSIGSDAFEDCTSLESVTIGNGVTSIGSDAFYDCNRLESITIPDSVTSIGSQAFYDCSSLSSITIPDSVTSIGWGAFENCTSLASINVSENNTVYSSVDGILYNKEQTEFIHIPKQITNVTIPDSVTSIGNSAFYNCTSLASITIPDSVTSIGSQAFEDCTSLESVTIGNGVTSIGYQAFSGCSSLVSISVSEKNEKYSSVDGVLFNKDKTELIKYPAAKTISEYSVPDGVTSIVGKAFYGCNKMSQITIPATVETIDEKAIGYSSAGNIITVFKIYGVSGTAAETYALANGITFIDVNNTPYMSKTELSLNVGDNFVLEVKNFSGDIAWSSNDSSIATVKEGLVSAVGAGETVVYAIIGASVLKCSVIVQPGGTVTTTATTTSASTSTTVTTTSIVSTTASSNGTTDETTAQTTTVPVTTTSSTPETTTSETVPVTTVNTDIFDVKENNGTIIIVNCDNLVVNVIVPETIDGKTVSKVNDYAFSSEEIESVQFENPDIEIFDSATTINEDAVIYGYWDSTAHEYAEKYNRTFVSLDGEPDYLPGDISGNDKIDLYDAIEICKSIMGMRTFTDAEKQIADFDGNGKVDLYDAIGIAKKLLER